MKLFVLFHATNWIVFIVFPCSPWNRLITPESFIRLNKLWSASESYASFYRGKIVTQRMPFLAINARIVIIYSRVPNTAGNGIKKKYTYREDVCRRAPRNCIFLRNFVVSVRPIRLFMTVLKLKATLRCNIYAEDERCDPNRVERRHIPKPWLDTDGKWKTDKNAYCKSHVCLTGVISCTVSCNNFQESKNCIANFISCSDL